MHLSPFLFHISLLVSFKHPALLLFNPCISFFSWPAHSHSLNIYIYILWSASHNLCDSVLSDTCGFCSRSCALWSLCVHVCESTRIFCYIYSWIFCQASLDPWLNLFLSVHSHAFSANVCFHVFFSLSHYYQKSAVMHSGYSDTLPSFRLCSGRKKEWENHSNSFPFTLISSWDSEERLRALRPHESCLSYCCGRRPDEALGMKV